MSRLHLSSVLPAPVLVFALVFVLAAGLCPVRAETEIKTETETPRPYLFGINAGASHRQLQAARAAGCTNIRIGLGWDRVEPSPGVLDFRKPDNDVALCEEYGLEPFFLIVATPEWALSPEKRDKPYAWAAEPDYYDHAAGFYRSVAARYRGRVTRYEFWNEPNGYGWNRTNAPEEYAPILRIAYKALKEGNPDCVVAIGGLDGAGWKGYVTYLQKLYDLGCGDSFDAVAVHPYRWDGPIDAVSLHRIHEILVRHGHGHRRLWLTEYGWSKEYGHHNKARWLEASLDLLTDPLLDFVTQASIHTLADFDVQEFGMMDRDLNPRPAYQVFKDYPKDWEAVIARRQRERPRPAVAMEEPFDQSNRAWEPFGDGFAVVPAESAGKRAESGEKVLRAPAEPVAAGFGGAWLRLYSPAGIPVELHARALTGDGEGRCRVGIDPAGGVDPGAGTIVWGRAIATYGYWDSVSVGHGDRVIPQGDYVTLFLHYERTAPGQLRLFDQVRFLAIEDGFVLPEPGPVDFEAGRPLKSSSAWRAIPDPSPVDPVDESRLIFSLPTGGLPSRGGFARTEGEWEWVVDQWVGPRHASGRRGSLSTTVDQPLPGGSWQLNAEVFSPGLLNLGFWFGRDPDDCVLAVVDDESREGGLYFVEQRNGQSGERIGQVAAAPDRRSASWLQVTRDEQGLHLVLDGAPVAFCPADRHGDLEQFGFYCRRPGTGLFTNVRLLRTG